MALPARLLALATLTLATVASAAPSAEEIVKKARAALAKDTSFLDRVTTVHYEGKVLETDGKTSQGFILETATGGKRRELRYDGEFTTEVSIVTNGMEAWARRADLTSGRSEAARVLPHEVAQRLGDMARSDLGFYAPPAPDRGSIKLKATEAVEGRRAYSIEYTYRSGYTCVRHFDAETYALIATDYPQAEGKVERQVEEETQLAEGIRVPKKVRILQDGKARGTLVFEKAIVNGEISESAFTFPVR